MTNDTEQSCQVSSVHCQLRWLTLENRLVFNTTTIFRNTVFSAQPIFLCNQIVRCSQVHSHFTRSADDGQMMLPKSNALKRTFIYHAINHWTNCPLNTLLFQFVSRNGHSNCMNATMIVTMNVITFSE